MRYGLIAGLLPGIVGFFAIILGVGLLVQMCSTEPRPPVTSGPELNDWPPWDPSPAKRKLARDLANALRAGGFECQVPGRSLCGRPTSISAASGAATQSRSLRATASTRTPPAKSSRSN